MNKKTYFLVYQDGIANVFRYQSDLWGDREFPLRILQGDFRSCEVFCQGLIEAGAEIQVAWRNEVGDIRTRKHAWNFKNFDDAPFSEKFIHWFID